MIFSWNVFNKSNYLECTCFEHGVMDEICEQDTGFCLCLPGYGNPTLTSISEKCDYCTVNDYEKYYGFPDCKRMHFLTTSLTNHKFSFIK